MYRELVWRFGASPRLVSIPRAHEAGFRPLVLRRDFLHAVYSHAADHKHAWDGSLEAHALVLAAHTTLLSAMLARLPCGAWRSFDPGLLSAPAPGLRAACLRALAQWLRWDHAAPPESAWKAAHAAAPPPPRDRLTAQTEGHPTGHSAGLPAGHSGGYPEGSRGCAPSDDDLLAVLSEHWRASLKDPAAALSREKLGFIARLVAARRADGSWAALEDPRQAILWGALQLPGGDEGGADASKMLGEVGAGDASVGAQAEIINTTKALRAALVEAGGRLEDYMYTPAQAAAAAAPAATSPVTQSVAWPLRAPHLGPFSGCPRPPDWRNVEDLWGDKEPRPPGLVA